MKVRMLNTVKLLGTWPMVTFHKGTAYNAIHATNQPNWRAKGLIFVEKCNGQSMLVGEGDYTVLAGN